MGVGLGTKLNNLISHIALILKCYQKFYVEKLKLPQPAKAVEEKKEEEGKGWTGSLPGLGMGGGMGMMRLATKMLF